MSVFDGGGGLLMGHSDPAEASIHSPQHDSATWGEDPSILYEFIVKISKYVLLVLLNLRIPKRMEIQSSLKSNLPVSAGLR